MPKHPILHILCSEQPFPERTLKLDPKGQPSLIGRASVSDKDHKDSANALASPENAKFVCSVMSRTHAQLTWVNNRPYLQDTGSTHGTWYIPSPFSSNPSRPRSTSTASTWQKIPNPLRIYDGCAVRFGRAIVNPVTGSRHTPLEVTFRIPQLTNASPSGTYGLKASHYSDSSDESEVEEDSTKEDPIGPDDVDVPHSKKETSPAHPDPSNLLKHSATTSATIDPSQNVDPIESVFNPRSTAVTASAQKPSKRSAHLPPNSAQSPDHRSSQPSKRPDHPKHPLLSPPYEHCQSPVPSHKKASGDPTRSTGAAEPNHSKPEELGNNPNSREHPEGHDNTPGGDRVANEEENGQETVSTVESRNAVQAEHGNITETQNTHQDHADVSEERSEVEDEDNDEIEEEDRRIQGKEIDTAEHSEDQGDSREMSEEVSRFENLQDQALEAQGPQNQNTEQNSADGVAFLDMDENQHSSESSPPTSTEEAGSLITTSEEERVAKKQRNQLLTRSSYKDVSVVTTITSKTKFTESLSRLPKSLERTFQVSFKLNPPHPHSSLAETLTEHHASNRLPILQTLAKKPPKFNRQVQSEPENAHHPKQIQPVEHSPASSEPQSPVVTNDDSLATNELKRKRSGDEKEDEEEEEEEEDEVGGVSMDGEKITECERSGGEKSDGKRMKKRVKRATNSEEDDQPVVCSHCSKEVRPPSKKRKLGSRVLSAAKSVAIFALGGVATVAGILAFENLADEL